MNDTDLMLQLKNGDETAFRKIVETYQDFIYRLTFRYLGNQQDAVAHARAAGTIDGDHRQCPEHSDII